MYAKTRIWVIEETGALTPRIRLECPDLEITAVRRQKISASHIVPALAVNEKWSVSVVVSMIPEPLSESPETLSGSAAARV